MPHETRQRDRVRIIHFPDDRSAPGWRQPVLALGNFDGVHRGHAKIIQQVRRRADEQGAAAAALTFDPHPSRVVRPDKAPPLLMTGPQKLAALAEAAGWTASRWCGSPPSCRAGSRRPSSAPYSWSGCRSPRCGWGRTSSSGTSGPATSRGCGRWGARYGFRAEKIDPVRYRDFVVSSTRIRRLIAEGRVDEAGSLLGHHYMLAGTVARGDGRGRRIGYPTANLATDNALLPPNGVYAAAVLMEGDIHAAVTNVGVRPTFGGRAGRSGRRVASVRRRSRPLRARRARRVHPAPARGACLPGRRGAAGADRPRLRRRPRAVPADFTVRSREAWGRPTARTRRRPWG